MLLNIKYFFYRSRRYPWY